MSKRLRGPRLHARRRHFVALLLRETDHGGIDARIGQTLTRGVHVLELRERSDAHAIVRHAARIALRDLRFEALEAETRALLLRIRLRLVRADLQEIAGVRRRRARAAWSWPSSGAEPPFGGVAAALLVAFGAASGFFAGVVLAVFGADAVVPDGGTSTICGSSSMPDDCV